MLKKYLFLLYYDGVGKFRGMLWSLFFGGTHEHLIIGNNCSFLSPRKICVGDHVRIGHNGDIHAYDEKIKIGNDVEIGPYVSIIGNNHVFKEKKILMRLQGQKSEEINIENNVWIGTKATVLAGVTIHNGAVVGAGAVVTKDVAAYSVIGGVPAKVIRYRT